MSPLRRYWAGHFATDSLLLNLNSATLVFSFWRQATSGPVGNTRGCCWLRPPFSSKGLHYSVSFIHSHLNEGGLRWSSLKPADRHGYSSFALAVRIVPNGSVKLNSLRRFTASLFFSVLQSCKIFVTLAVISISVKSNFFSSETQWNCTLG